MKRSSLIVTLIMLFVCGSTTSSMAALTVQTVGSQTVVYDDVTQYYWYQDLTAFVNQTYSEQLDTIAGLSQGGINWEMATRDEAYDLLNRYQGAEIGDSFTLTYQTISDLDGGEDGLWEYHEGRTSTITVDEMSTQRAVVKQTASYHLPLTSRESCLHSASISVDEILDSRREETLGAWVVCKDDLSNIPEPASLMLLVSGLTSLFAIRKKVIH